MNRSSHFPGARKRLPTEADAAFVDHLYDLRTAPADEEAHALRALIADLDALPPVRPDAAVLDRIAIAADAAARPRLMRLPHYVRYAVAACLVLAVGLGVLLTRDTTVPVQAEALPAWDTQDDIYTINRRLDDLKRLYEEEGWDTAVPLESFGGTAPAGQTPVGYQR